MNYVCESCGAKYKRWIGKCSNCNQWSTIVEENTPSKSGSLTGLNLGGKTFSPQNVEITNLSDQKEENLSRIPTKISELDRVLGGGFIKGGAILIGGDPGIGKSTLLLQVSGILSSIGKKIMYISGEESASQIFMRAKRLEINQDLIKVASTGSILDILHKIEGDLPDVMVVDSIQTVYISSLENNPGTVNQIRASCFELINFCKNKGIILIIVGHVTKDGQLAGPKLLEHMVDTVIYFEGDNDKDLRILRAVKNRFGNISEVGIFTMTNRGLEEVSNPSSFFMSKKSLTSGSIIFPAIEGTRPVITEIESLVSTSYLPSPRRNVVGWDGNRLAMVTAVLQNRCKISLHDKDIYLNVAGGFKTIDPAADLAVAVSLFNSKNNKEMKDDVVVLGEIALSGEIRNVSWAENRINECVKLGYKKYIIPKSPISDKLSRLENITVTACSFIQDIVSYNN